MSSSSAVNQLNQAQVTSNLFSPPVAGSATSIVPIPATTLTSTYSKTRIAGTRSSGEAMWSFSSKSRTSTSLIVPLYAQVNRTTSKWLPPANNNRSLCRYSFTDKPSTSLTEHYSGFPSLVTRSQDRNRRTRHNNDVNYTLWWFPWTSLQSFKPSLCL